MKPRNRWVIGRHSDGVPHVRMICIPQSGAGAGAFTGWRRHIPAGVELAPVELPGRGTRDREPLPVDIHAMADALFEGLRPELEMPYVLFGHSLGGLLAYEVVRRVQDAGLREPLAVLISGARAPHVPTLHAMGHADDKDLLAWLMANGGMPEELLEYPDFLRDILRGVRADLLYADSYLVPDPPIVSSPLHVFGGAADDVTPPDETRSWERCAGSDFSVTILPGGHSFPHDSAAELFAAIRDRVPLPAPA